MAVYSPFPVLVDGVRLDSSAWNIETKMRAIPGVRNGDTVLPGTDGVAQSLNDDFEPSTFVITMWLLGTDANGLIPANSNAMAQCRANLDELAFLFAKRHALLNVTEVVDAQGTTRQFFGKVVDRIEPRIRAGGLGQLTVTLSVGDSLWQDELAADWSQANAPIGSAIEVTTLLGSTGPINDATFLVTGPITNPQLTDFATGAYCRLNAVLPAGQQWRLNSGSWSTRYGSGLTLASADTLGTSGDGITVNGGGNARMLRLQPMTSGGARRVFILLNGTSTTTATSVAVRARRKYLQ